MSGLYDGLVVTELLEHFYLRATQSIGLLSYTFLRSTGKEDIVVPMVMMTFFSLFGLKINA